MRGVVLVAGLMLWCLPNLRAQEGTYANSLAVEAPYYRVRYEASTKDGELIYPVSYTIWVPPGVKTLRGVVVHQHGCGEGSCKSGQTGAFDLHWQALAKKHDCALIAPVVEQPEKADCQMWCDPRNGSDAAFQKALKDLAGLCGHPELPDVPWALWGHSGGGHWAGGMVLLHPDRVAAAWLRSGVPAVVANPSSPKKPYDMSEASLTVPVMCNLGTKEGVTDKEGRFAGVWPGVETFWKTLRAKRALIGVSIDPISSHDCGNQRYLAIPWLDACLTLRLPMQPGQPLREIPADSGWLTTLKPGDPAIEAPVPASEFRGELNGSIWLPTESIASAWVQYTRDTNVSDATVPPAPGELKVNGTKLTWTAEADAESGLAGFLIFRDGKELARVPEQPKNPFGRPLFQNLSYSDTPTQPLINMEFTDAKPEPGAAHSYKVCAVNTVGLQSEQTGTTKVAILDPQQPYTAQTSHPVTWTGELILTITAPYKTKLLRAWVPVPPTDSVQTVHESRFSTFPLSVEPKVGTEERFGNTFAYFEFPNPQGAQVIRHQLKISTSQLNWNIDPARVETPEQWPVSFEPWLKGEQQAVVLDDRFDELMKQIVPERRNPLLDMDAVMTWADENFVYDHSKASLQASSLHAVENRRGHCSDYHGFCAAMGRLLSVPTRVTYGINPFPKASPSHCKLEAFLPPYGWVSFDVSETQKLAGLIRADKTLSDEQKQQRVSAVHARLVQGFRDNTWFLQTRGTDYDLVPRASQRVPVVRTLYAEADGKPLPDPDPANVAETKFAWMTAHRFDSDQPAPNPFTEVKPLK